jgi:hypothetical protein
MKKSLVTIFVMFSLVLLAMPAYAADGDTGSSSDGAGVIKELISPVNGIREVLQSPAGAPLKKIINLVVGFAIVCTLFALIKDYLHSHSDNSEKSSSGFLNMGKHTFGFLILLTCLSFVGYFMNFSV